MTGRNIVKAMNTKNTPEPSSKPKYIRAFPEGTLLVADCKFPGRSLTPLETLVQKLPNMNNKLAHQNTSDTSIEVLLFYYSGSQKAQYNITREGPLLWGK